ncbi:HlyU family transcriptional regulator [Allorhizobium sp. BGMRC 0089]|uniref:HlyU family transcriptional regulator n=1 Tax=Allorhizobium sonneratiae TaxID=2934936 RepID=UPI002033A5B1|nr:HlyU family transcriptional regulator [Allorhizobium sonneratiae]MCM2292980.1 HlyU family transcriptional regulator [Allorhizobium sonneratiae]
MASFFSKILSAVTGGAGQQESETASATEAHLHGDVRIYPEPIKEGSQFRLAGRIEKDVNGETLVRSFIRADVFSSRDDALECTLRKAKQIIDQSGGALFADGEKTRNI